MEISTKYLCLDVDGERLPLIVRLKRAMLAVNQPLILTEMIESVEDSEGEVVENRGLKLFMQSKMKQSWLADISDDSEDERFNANVVEGEQLTTLIERAGRSPIDFGIKDQGTIDQSRTLTDFHRGGDCQAWANDAVTEELVRIYMGVIFQLRKRDGRRTKPGLVRALCNMAEAFLNVLGARSAITTESYPDFAEAETWRLKYTRIHFS